MGTDNAEVVDMFKFKQDKESNGDKESYRDEESDGVISLRDNITKYKLKKAKLESIRNKENANTKRNYRLNNLKK